MTWAALLRLAALSYGVAPEAFWRLSLKEWRALCEDAGAPALGRGGFEALAAAWPDAAAEERGDG